MGWFWALRYERMVYWIFTLGMKTPAVRKLGIIHLSGGSEWDISKAKELLGYVPIPSLYQRIIEN